MRVDEHAKQDGNSTVDKHAVEQMHATATLKDYTISNKLFSSHTFHREIKEALLIRNHKPSMNVQTASVSLLLF